MCHLQNQRVVDNRNVFNITFCKIQILYIDKHVKASMYLVWRLLYIHSKTAHTYLCEGNYDNGRSYLCILPGYAGVCVGRKQSNATRVRGSETPSGTTHGIPERRLTEDRNADGRKK